MVNIYVLLLQNNKYYVGRTNNLDARILSHFNANGSQWTRLYKPIKIYKTYDGCDIFDEDKYTIKMMAKFGIDNVRGGTFCKLTLSEEEIIVIRNMITNTKDECFNCKSPKHFVRQCNYNIITNKNLILVKDIFIEKCKTINENVVSIDQLVNILQETDSIIFNTIDKDDIYRLCNHMNNEKNIEIDIKNINYRKFIFGIIDCLCKR